MVKSTRLKQLIKSEFVMRISKTRFNGMAQRMPSANSRNSLVERSDFGKTATIVSASNLSRRLKTRSEVSHWKISMGYASGRLLKSPNELDIIPGHSPNSDSLLSTKRNALEF